MAAGCPVPSGWRPNITVPISHPYASRFVNGDRQRLSGGTAAQSHIDCVIEVCAEVAGRAPGVPENTTFQTGAS